MNLVNFVSHKRVEDLTHVVFPDVSYEEMQQDIRSLAESIVDYIAHDLQRYLDSKDVPSPGEIVMTDIIPPELPSLIADLIDAYRPAWNIVQKTTLFTYYLMRFREEAQQYWNNLCLKKAQELGKLNVSDGGPQFTSVVPDNPHNN